ncbi:hypothetical protein C8Q79DRAFT_902811, partial [Trametes meyenii]
MTIASIPTDLATARNRFPLDPEYTLYACCPLCFALHPSQAPVPTEATEKDEHPLPPDLIGVLPPYIPPQPRRDSRSPLRFPDKCQYQATRTSTRCGTKLLRQGIDSRRPIRTYAHQSLVSWLGRLLIRPDIEHHLDASQANVGPNPSGSVEDILESREVLNFMGPDGQPFLRHCGSEGRYLFSLFVDWFNPRGNKHGGATYSAGVIFMVSPSLDQVNHFLGPLVQELLQFWSRGVYYSRTAYRPQGRMTRCAVLPLICDLAAGRKTSGQASHSSALFCSFCQLLKSLINNLDKSSWPRR